MPAIVKLKEGAYIEWSGPADAFVSNVLTKAEVTEILTNSIKVNYLFKGQALTPVQLDEEVLKLWHRIESTGTSDSAGCVNLDWVLKYNSIGPNGDPGNLDEILKQFTKNPNN